MLRLRRFQLLGWESLKPRIVQLPIAILYQLLARTDAHNIMFCGYSLLRCHKYHERIWLIRILGNHAEGRKKVFPWMLEITGLEEQ
jgi:hypothetical protein